MTMESLEKLPGPLLRRLKALGQKLEPVVHIGKSGLSPALLESLEHALRDHELIKARFDAHKEEKKALAPELATRSRSHIVQRVGNVVVLYRPHADPTKRKFASESPSAEATADEAVD